MSRIPLDKRTARESHGSGRVYYLTSIDRRRISERRERRILAFAALAVLFLIGYAVAVVL